MWPLLRSLSQDGTNSSRKKKIRSIGSISFSFKLYAVIKTIILIISLGDIDRRNGGNCNALSTQNRFPMNIAHRSCQFSGFKRTHCISYPSFSSRLSSDKTKFTRTTSKKKPFSNANVPTNGKEAKKNDQIVRQNLDFFLQENAPSLFLDDIDVGKYSVEDIAGREDKGVTEKGMFENNGKSAHISKEVQSGNSLVIDSNLPDDMQTISFNSILVSQPQHISTDDIPVDNTVNLMGEAIQNDKNERKDFPISEIWFARILLIGAAALYSTNFTLVKILGDHVPIGASSMLRFIFAASVTMPLLFCAPESELHGDSVTLDFDIPVAKDISPGYDFSLAMAGMEIGLWNAVGYIAQAIGLQTICASKSAFICSLAVVVVPIINGLQGKPISTRSFVAAFLAVIGVGFLELGDLFLSETGNLGIGDIASLLQPVVFGIGFWRTEHAMTKYPTEGSRITAWQILAVALVSTAYCFSPISGVEPPSIQDIVSWISDPTILGALIWTGCITTALTLYMETQAFKTLSATEATLILSSEPLFGAAFAAVVVGERFGLTASVGSLLIILGCVWGTVDDDSEMVVKK